MGRRKQEFRETEEGKNFLCIIYPDSESYDYQLILNRLESFWDKWYYIYHDKDFYTELDKDRYETRNKEKAPFEVGEIKKPHYHIIGSLNSSRTLANASTKFGIPSNMVERVGNFKKSVQYLIHANNPEKYQYDKKEIITNDDELEKVLKMKSSDTEKAKTLLEFIETNLYVNMTSLTHFAITNNCWDELRRGQHIYSQLVKEQNQIKNQKG